LITHGRLSSSLVEVVGKNAVFDWREVIEALVLTAYG
jgi:hypothetical protein